VGKAPKGNSYYRLPKALPRVGDGQVTYNPNYSVGEPQFRQPAPSEKEKIRGLINWGVIFFFISAIVFIIIAVYEMVTYASLRALDNADLKEFLGSAYRSANTEELQLAILVYLIAAIVLLVFGIVNLALALFTRSKALIPLDKSEFEEAGRYLNLLTVMGFIFGLVIAGVCIFKAKDLLKKTAVRMSSSIAVTTSNAPQTGTGEVHRCQICNSMMNFNPSTRMWFCSSCKRYQM
jgi:magnesium-transporting ATPase (P-type)